MSKGIVVPALAAAFFAGLPAHAQDQYRDHDGWQQQRDSEHWQDRRDDARWQDRGADERWQDHRADERRREEGREARQEARRDGRFEGGMGRTEDFNAGFDGAGPYHNLRRGEPLPLRYRTHQYVVDRWRAHHLPRPPHGYKWVQTGADYVLVGESSGIIARVVIGR